MHREFTSVSKGVVMGRVLVSSSLALLQAALWGVVVVVVVGVEGRALGTSRGVMPAKPCAAPPLFVFGASYLDVGENAAAMPFRESAEREPYGLDYFDGKPSGRFSNGRVITDHISQGLGQALLSPYLRHVGTSFAHGVNFASSGSTARNSSVVGDGSESMGIFSLSVQVDQFRVFHKQTLAVYTSNTDTAEGLPGPEDFARGVYIIESGGNDYRFHWGAQVDEALISSVLEHIEHAIRALYLDGARNIIVMDFYPIGCYPGKLSIANGPQEINEDRCWIPATKLVERHNTRLQAMMPNLNTELPGANLIIFSLFDMFMSAIRNPPKFGLKYVHKACCGYGGGDYNFNENVWCGTEGIIDGQLRRATVCGNRSEYMLWDGLHPTDAFSFHIAQAFLKGQHMQPPFYIKEMCDWPQQQKSL